MPQAFDWLIEDQLGVCVNPSVATQAADELRTRGIRLLINLYEGPDPPELLARLDLRTLHLPVQNSDPPTQDQLDQGVAAIHAALQRGVRVAVHCQAGLGRSGTLLAAYLVSCGRAPDDAITEVRIARPGAVETASQEAAVHSFAHRHAAELDADRHRNDGQSTSVGM